MIFRTACQAVGGTTRPMRKREDHGGDSSDTHARRTARLAVGDSLPASVSSPSALNAPAYLPIGHRRRKRNFPAEHLSRLAS
jgi:hypothetical protein